MLEASAPVTAMLYGGDGGVAGPGWDASPYSNISVIIDEIHLQPRDDHPAAQVSIKWQTSFRTGICVCIHNTAVPTIIVAVCIVGLIVTEIIADHCNIITTWN